MVNGTPLLQPGAHLHGRDCFNITGCFSVGATLLLLFAVHRQQIFSNLGRGGEDDRVDTVTMGHLGEQWCSRIAM